MSHFAEIDKDGVVKRVIVAEQDFINSGAVGDTWNWVQTSYNTYGGQHTGGGTPLRKNYAGIGYTYDSTADAFYAPRPFASWTLDTNTYLWNPPTAHPNDGNRYTWNEGTRSWDAYSYV